MAEIKELVKEVNRLLQVGEPGNISVDDYSHFTGYKPQHIIDAMNEAFSYGGWGFEELSSTLEEGLAIAQVRVWLKGVEFQPTGWGQARITKGDRGDAHKGAQTDAIKKALSYFSIGNRAYLGLLVAPDKGQRTAGNTGNSNRPQQNPKPAGTPARQPQTIPNARALREKVNALQIQSKRGGVMNWPQVLAYVFADQIEAGSITLDALVKQGDNLTADYCKIIMQFIQTVEEGRAKKVS